MQNKIDIMLRQVEEFYRSRINNAKKFGIKEKLSKGNDKHIKIFLNISFYIGLFVFFSVLTTKFFPSFKLQYRGDLLRISFAMIVDSRIIFALHKQSLLNEIKLRMNDIQHLQKLKRILFPSKMPSIEQLDYLKILLNEKFKEKRLHRNIFVAFILFFINLFFPLIKDLPFIKSNISIMIVSVILFVLFAFITYILADYHSKYVQFDLLFIKNGQNLKRLQDLIDYLIYQSK
ncbi:hypothetical protein [Leuconostoc citreum]